MITPREKKEPSMAVVLRRVNRMLLAIASSVRALAHRMQVFSYVRFANVGNSALIFRRAPNARVARVSSGGLHSRSSYAISRERIQPRQGVCARQNAYSRRFARRVFTVSVPMRARLDTGTRIFGGRGHAAPRRPEADRTTTASQTADAPN
jgi:hypothetical protein